MSQEPNPARLDFGECPRCPYVMTGTVHGCFKCARETIPVIRQAESCRTCDVELDAAGNCGNPLCNRPAEQRGWGAVWAISRRRGELRSAISSYKYDGRWGWSLIFARIVVGYLEQHAEEMSTFDMIVPSPTFVGDGGREWGHTERIIEEAAKIGPTWPFRLDVLEKTEATPRLASAGSFMNRAYIAETDIARSLRVTRDVEGQSILVFDDVFTGGLTLREISWKLLAAGASDVYGLALARQPFGG